MPAKAIPGFEDYLVDPQGAVFSLKRNKYLRTGLNTKGYPSVRLYNCAKGHTFAVHRLVAEVFIENPDRLPQVDHIDGDKTNNHYTNLRWVTNQTNCAKALAKVVYLQHKDGTGTYIRNFLEWCQNQGFDQATFYKMKNKKRKSAYGYNLMEAAYPC